MEYVTIFAGIFIIFTTICIIFSLCENKYKQNNIIGFTDANFIWILKEKRWMKYNKKTDTWTIMSSPPS